MRHQLKLVTFETPIWSTIQGEGVLVGTPSVFIRLFGCDYACEWCDTKRSWQPGSVGADYDLEAVVSLARTYRLGHAVITGGNPVLQTSLPELIVALQASYYETLTEELPKGLPRGVNEGLHPGMHVTVETQASIFDEAVAIHADLMSISPKLHDWRGEVVRRYISAALPRDKDIQVKIVVTSTEDVSTALRAFEEMFGYAISIQLDLGQARRNLHFILQPESSLGRKGVGMVRSALEEWHLHRPCGVVTPTVRLIPQVHKTSLFVR